jgi:peptidoglycan hydrolase-like protein with peptidoglycan-binding domain
LASDVLPDTASVAIAVETRPPTAATLFAAGLATAVAAPDANSATVLPGLAKTLAGADGVTVAGVKAASKGQDLNRLPAVQPPGAIKQAVPAPAAASAPMPDDAAMTLADRRRVQIALASLGYYDGRLDGIFGPDSRAAIRRYQHEIGAAMTGTLDAAQASRLVAGAH